MSKKYIYITLAILGLALILIGFILNENLKKEMPNIPDIQPSPITQEKSENNNELETPAKVTEKNFTSTIKLKPNKTTKIIKSTEVLPKNTNTLTETQNGNNETASRKLSPEEEELLKKVPSSKEVLVDKEIKLKSSSKYYFK